MMKRSEIKSYETWNAEELAGFISNQGLESYSHTIIDHKITGKLAPLLSEMDLKEMGITCIGDRLRFRLIVDNLKIKKRSLKRTQIVWEGRERIYYSEVTASILRIVKHSNLFVRISCLLLWHLQDHIVFTTSK